MDSIRTRAARAAALGVAITLLPLHAAHADAIVVGPGDSIQAAIAAAAPGDEVVVLPGTYNEPLNLLGKAITLRSQDGPGTTILSGAGLSESTIRCITAEGPGTVIQGFTVTQGSASSGGGLRILAASPTVRGCVFSFNTALNGSGIHCGDSSATITGCDFHGNGAFTDTGRGAGISIHGGAVTVSACTFSGNKHVGGGAIYTHDGAPIITGCTFENNASEAKPGGALWCEGGSPVITGCTFNGNLTNFSTGGALMLQNTAARILDCDFTGNTALSFGSGAVAIAAGSPVIARCTFTDNDGLGAALGVTGGDAAIVSCLFTRNRGIEGGAVLLDGDATVVNCTFAGNTADSAAGAITIFAAAPLLVGCTIVGNAANQAGAILSMDAAPVIIGSIIWNNQSTGGGPVVVAQGGAVTITRSCVQGGWPGEGNTAADPLLFTAPTTATGSAPSLAIYRLLPGSPCIDAGDSTAFPPDRADLNNDGDTAETTPFDARSLPRLVDDPAVPDSGEGASPVADMGASEHQAAAEPCPTDWNRDGVVNSGDISSFLTAWIAAMPNAPLGADVNADGWTTSADISAFLARWLAEVGGC